MEISRLVASCVSGRQCGGSVGLDVGSIRVVRLEVSLRVQLPPPVAWRHVPAHVGRLLHVDPDVRAQRQVAGLAAAEEEKRLAVHAAPLAQDGAIILAIHQHRVAVGVAVLNVHGPEGGERQAPYVPAYSAVDVADHEFRQGLSGRQRKPGRPAVPIPHVQAKGGREKGDEGDGGGRPEVRGVTVTHDDGGSKGDPVHSGRRQRQQANVSVLVHHQHLHEYTNTNTSFSLLNRIAAMIEQYVDFGSGCSDRQLLHYS